MNGELPILYCKCCGRKLKPYWLEGYEGMIRYEELDGKPYREYKVYFRCPKKWDFGGEHSFITHTIKKLADSDYRLPESIKEYLRLS